MIQSDNYLQLPVQLVPITKRRHQI
jgi:hypothetical protein